MRAEKIMDRREEADSKLCDDKPRASENKEGGPSDRREGGEAFVTMVTSDDFVIGAELMLHSLREHSLIRRPQLVIVTSSVSKMKRRALEAVADEVIEVRSSEWTFGCDVPSITNIFSECSIPFPTSKSAF